MTEPRDLPPLPSPERLQELFYDAARMGRDDVLPALIAAGVDIGAPSAAGYTALILASYHGREESTRLLLDAGADPDAPDGARGNTALMGVAFKGFTAIARLLLDRGAAVDACNHAGQTALMNAALFGHEDIVDLLLGAGADPDRIDAAGNSPASVARAQGNAKLADRLGTGTGHA